jgi:hypothetical protein
LSSWIGSPASCVAPTFVPATSALSPAIVSAAAKSSLGGEPMRVSDSVKSPPLPAYPCAAAIR